MHHFHLTIHAAPDELRLAGALEIQGVYIRTLQLQDAKRTLPIAVTFESAVKRLQQLPRMFVEMDGSFVWTSDTRDWQVDGVLYDRNDQLLYVELKGNCNAPVLGQLLLVLVTDESPIIFQFTQQAVFVDWTNLERWLNHFSEH
jgi:hypothetical protein